MADRSLGQTPVRDGLDRLQKCIEAVGHAHHDHASESERRFGRIEERLIDHNQRISALEAHERHATPWTGWSFSRSDESSLSDRLHTVEKSVGAISAAEQERDRRRDYDMRWYAMLIGAVGVMTPVVIALLGLIR